MCLEEQKSCRNIEMIDNMSLNEDLYQSNGMSVINKQKDLSLDTHDTLLASNELLSDKLEAITKKLEAQEKARLSITDVVYNFCQQAHESDTCLPTSLGVSEEQVNYMGGFTMQKMTP